MNIIDVAENAQWRKTTAADHKNSQDAFAHRRTSDNFRKRMKGGFSLLALVAVLAGPSNGQTPNIQNISLSGIEAIAGESKLLVLPATPNALVSIASVSTSPPLQFPPQVNLLVEDAFPRLRVVIPPATPAGDYSLEISGRSANDRPLVAAIRLTVKAVTFTKSSTGRNPVILLNGFQLLCTNSASTIAASEATFGQLGPLLEADGAPVAFFNNCAYGDITIEKLAAQLNTFLAGLTYSDGTSVAQVDLVVHSMGGLIARAYLAGLQSDGSFSPPSSAGVRKLVEIATPNFGSFVAAQFPLGTQVSEMIPGSSFLWSLGTWNQWGEDLRGVDTLAIIGNGGSFGNSKAASDGVVSLTSASLGFARDPSRTKILPYCHIDSNTLEVLIGAVYCLGAGIADVDNAPETGEIIRSFLADTSAWTAIGASPSQNAYLSQYGGLYVTLRSATGQYVNDLSKVNWGSIALQNGGASDEIYYSEFLEGSGAIQFTSGSLGGVSCGSFTEPPGFFFLFRCKYGPILNGVTPLIQGVLGTFVNSGTTITINGVGLGQQCPTCQVVAYPGKVSLSVSSWTDQAIVVFLPAGVTGFVQLLVTASGGSDFINVMAVAAPRISLSNNQLQLSYTVGGASPPAQSITVSNLGGGGVLLWSAVSSSPWISVATASTFTLTVLVNPTGLAPGIYKGTVSVIASGAANSPQSLSVTLTVTGGASSSVIVTSVANSASGALGAVAPGEIISVKGSGLGPVGGVSFTVDPITGMLDSILAGTQVFFGSLAAPILYTSSGQVNAIVPYELAGQSQVVMQVSYQGVRSTGTTISVASSAPGIFTIGGTGSGQAVAANQNGSFNGSSNPASAGSYVTLYFTGGGQTNPQGVTGSVTGSVLKWFTQSIAVTVGGQPAAVSFDGAAPSFVDGVGQLNIQLAGNTPSGVAEPVVIVLGGITSPSSATLSVTGTTGFSTMLGAGTDGNLYGIVPTTGATVFIGKLPEVMSDIAAFNGSLYGISDPSLFETSTLYRINPDTGVSTAIGDTSISLNALVFGSTGTLYAAGGDSLYTINPSTAKATLVGKGSGAGTYNSSGDLEFDNTGKLYLTSSTSSAGDQLFSINSSTGQGVLVGNIGFKNVYGLVYLNGTMYGFTALGQVIAINLSTGAGTLVATYLPGFDGTTLISGTGVASPIANLPIITAVNQISATQNQTIVITGSGFGTMKPYIGDSSNIEVSDVTGGWNAGYSSDSVTLNVTSWTDSQIVIQGFQGSYGSFGWSLNSGDQIEIQVVNPQAGTGPAIFALTVR